MRLSRSGGSLGDGRSKGGRQVLEGLIPYPPPSPPPQAGIDSKEEHDNAKAILLEMGEFFQIQVGGGSPSLSACKTLVGALTCFHLCTG